MPLDPNVTVLRDAEGRETFVATGGPLAPLAPPTQPAEPADATPEEGGDGATEDAADGDGTNPRRRKR